MTAAPFKLLLVEDNPGDARLVQLALAGCAPGEFAVTGVERLADALARIQTGRFDAVLTDLGLPDSRGVATMQTIAAAAPALPLVVLTGSHDEDLGRAAIRHGAQDYLVKGKSDGVLIARTLRYAIERKRLENALREANESLERRVAERTAELEAAISKLRETEDRYRDLVENSQDLICTHDLEGKLLSVNAAAVRLTGYAVEALLAMNMADLLTRGARAGFATYLAKIHTTGAAHGLMCIRTAGGETRWWEYNNTLRTQGVAAPVVRGMAQDVTERKHAERALTRQKDLYEALSQTNQIIVRGVGREELFAAVCRIAVEHGRFRFAWIGAIDANDQRLKPVTRYGEDAGYIDALEVQDDGASAAGRSLTGRTLRSRAHVIINDFLDDPAMAKWHEAAARAGVRAAAKFPIAESGVVVGAINLYAGEPGFFTADLVATLNEMANDVSFALDNIAREAERRRAVEALQQTESQFRGLVEQSIAGICIIQDRRFAYVNPRFAEICGYARTDELIGLDAISLVATQDHDSVKEQYRRLLAGETPSIGFSFSARCKDGSSVEVGANGARATHDGRPAIIGLMQDISEKKRAEEQGQRYLAQLETALMSTVEVATALSELRDPYTAGHERRVGEIAVAIGAELGFDARQQEGLRVAGYLHDIGKITIPSEILSKPGKLTAIEFQLIQGHAQASYDVLKGVEFPWPVAEVALQHHERLDGSGYPQGLKGEAILLEARIMAVADVVEAMSSHRPYRAGLGIDKALAEIERGRGSAYDSAVADACLKLFREKAYAMPA